MANMLARNVQNLHRYPWGAQIAKTKHSSPRKNNDLRKYHWDAQMAHALAKMH